MKSRKTKLKEGQIFAIPLQNDNYGIGIVSRFNNYKALLFFGDKIFASLPAADDFSPEKRKIVYVVIASLLGFDKNEWPVLGDFKNWNRDDWEVPLFYRKDSLGDFYWQVTYSDQLQHVGDKIIKSVPGSDLYPEDGLAGYGYVEKKLSGLLHTN